MDKIITGNAITESNDTRGWFVGAFIKKQGLQKNSGVEIKFGEHPEGESHETKAAGAEVTTISLLIYGEYSLIFDDHEITMKNKGDYVIWKPNLNHKTKAHKDSLIITIRWPSLSSKEN